MRVLLWVSTRVRVVGLAAHHGKDDERDPDQQREEEPAEGGVVAIDVVVRGGRVERLAAQPAQ